MGKRIYHRLYFLLLISIAGTISDANHEKFVQCMSSYSSGYLKTFKYLHTPSTPSYSSLLQSAEQNPRWLNSTSPKPMFIITPYSATEIQAAIICGKKHGLQIRIKSGGHDYEGLSYLCKTPFVIIDLVNLRSISVDLEDETAWIQSGATLGELYYSIAKKSRVHGFPAGLCPSVGIGGHFSGGGFGTMLRKHGLAADNILDAYLIDVQGMILDRKLMGEDLFWAIRGGGGASFGVIVAWKIKLVRVPPMVTVFTIEKQLDQEGTKLVHKWQHIANKLLEDLFIRIVIQDSDVDGKFKQKTVELLFNSLFLGRINNLIALMDKKFPELGLQAKDCIEMSWIESVLYFTGYQKGQALEVLLDRTIQYKSYFKAKSDYVEKPIPETALKGIWERFLEEQIVFMIMDPYGGKMDEIPETELPFPHRKGNLYSIQYLVKWVEDGDSASDKHVNWIRMFYKYMKPYVSRSPRAAYINYRDLDLGINKQGNTSYSQAMIWGRKYFKGNFKRLARVKTEVDPENFFRNEQSIPLLVH
ncbi:FAD-binding Berberine family protein [Abeliophyllum distichum]|uniref:FAD-binding Berberine family protein n=1 Tax=Abeliophyllum distichum TaxID=126358 RepID=A0ABD1PU26_9LAMI